MFYIIDKRFDNVSTELIGPFADPETAYCWIDRAKKIPKDELGIERYVRESTEYVLRNMRHA